jgi:hypothetical protein
MIGVPNKKPPIGAAGGIWWPIRPGSHHPFRRFVMMILQAIFVAHDLPIEFIHQFIDRRIQIGVRTLGKDVAALDMDIALSSLPTLLFLLLFYGEQHLDIDYLIKMPNDPIKLARNVSAQSRGDF